MMIKIAFKPTKEQEKIFKYISKRKENLLIEARAGCGKCLGIDTPILMFDGSIKKVQNVVKGDILMGDDNQPRNVLSTNVGNGELYEVFPTKGDSWICNDVHVMTLYDDRTNEIIDISLDKITNHNKNNSGNLINYYIVRKENKSITKFEFKVKSIGVGDYFGFTLDGNGRFLLGDFTITHNTTTAIEALKLLPIDKSITFLAFNKHIQGELKTKLPEYVHCYTMHGMGFGAIKRAYGDSITMDEFKVDHILKKKSTSWGLPDEFKNDPITRNNYLKSMKTLVNLCRSTLTLERKWVEILADKYDIKYKAPNDIKRALSVLEILMNDRKTFDFTDMIFMPAVDKKIFLFPQDYVIVDEAQDLNKAQQSMIFKMLKRDKINKKKIIGRLIAIGDPYQSIYSFAGADQNSFEWFRKFKNTEVLPLTHTFRCGTAIVKKANEIVPDLKAMDGAHEGQVRTGDVVSEPEAGDFVLCRTTAPLLQLYMEYLSTGRKAMIKGSDIGLSLIEMTKDFNSVGRLLGHLATEMDNLKIKLRKQGILDFKDHSGYLTLKDSVETLKFLCHSIETIAQLRKKISDIFTDTIDGIMLSTVHKAKGLEADRVFIACPDKLPLRTGKAWEYQQEKNLEYVAITRAKYELIYDNEWQPIDLTDD